MPCTLYFRPALIPSVFQPLPAASTYPSTDVAKDSAVQVFPVRPQQRIQAEPGRRGAVVSNVGRGDGKGWGEEGRDGKWRGTEGDLPLSLCGLFQFPWLFVWSEFSA